MLDISWKTSENTRRDTIRCTFDTLIQIPNNLDKPTYVFAHFSVVLHPPFLFGKNGENITPDHGEISGLQSWENSQRYVNQLIFATDKISQVIEQIIEKDPSAIIVIQITGATQAQNMKSEKLLMIFTNHTLFFMQYEYLIMKI